MNETLFPRVSHKEKDAKHNGEASLSFYFPGNILINVNILRRQAAPVAFAGVSLFFTQLSGLSISDDA